MTQKERNTPEETPDSHRVDFKKIYDDRIRDDRRNNSMRWALAMSTAIIAVSAALSVAISNSI